MASIRQKRQNHRNQIRKQYLQNHFKTLRKRYFNFGNDGQSENESNIQVLQTILTKSQELNKLAFQIREENFFQQLNRLVQSAIKSRDKLEAKYLFTIISNMFRDQINPYEKEQLFKISVKLFQSLNLSFIDFKSKSQKSEYKNTLEIIQSQILCYYFSNVIVQSQFLQERDQQFVQKYFYSAFLNLLFYSLKHPKFIGRHQNFCKDVENVIFNIFDQKESSYETGNLLKAKRNEQFFIDIAMNHYFYINEKTEFPDFFQWIEKNLFFLYNKLTDYFQEIKHFFCIKEFWMVVQQTFQLQLCHENSRKMAHIFSIMRSFVDYDCFINEIDHLLLVNNQESRMSNFEIIIKDLSYRKQKQLQILDFLQGIMISYEQKNSFKQIIQIYGMSLFEILIHIFLDFDRQSLSNGNQRSIIEKVLRIMYAFIEKGNKEIHKKSNQYIICFEKQQGNKKIQQINEWCEENDLKQNEDLTEIFQFIDWLSIQFQISSSEEQVEI